MSFFRKLLIIIPVVVFVLAVTAAVGDALVRWNNSKYVSVRPIELQAKVDAATDVYIDGKDVNCSGTPFLKNNSCGRST